MEREKGFEPSTLCFRLSTSNPVPGQPETPTSRSAARHRHPTLELAPAGALHCFPLATALGAAFCLALLLTVGDERPPPPRFLQDAIAQDHLVEAAE